MADEEFEDGSRNVEGMLAELTLKLDRLRAMYDQYFLGIEKMAPLVLRKDVVRLIADLQKMQIRRTAVRFKLQQQIQRFNTMRTRWARTEREMEAGTYKLHLKRANRREQERLAQGDGLTAADIVAVRAVRDALGEEAAMEAEKARKEAAEARRTSAGEEAEAFLQQLLGSRTPEPGAPAEAGASSATPRPPAASEEAKGGAPASTLRGMSAEEIARRQERVRALQARIAGRAGDASAPAAGGGGSGAQTPPDRTKAIYDKLIATKRKLNESTDRLSVDGLERSLAKQREALRERHKCRDVDFDVVVKDGKAFIKPIPRF